MFHDPATFANGFPHETFRRLRADDPVSHHDHPTWKRGYWVVARHADVQRVSRDSATFSNAPNPFLDAEMPEDGDAAMAELLISQDPPVHTKLRKLINKGFTPRRVAELEDRVRDRVDRHRRRTRRPHRMRSRQRHRALVARCTSSPISSGSRRTTVSRSSAGPS